MACKARVVRNQSRPSSLLAKQLTTICIAAFPGGCHHLGRVQEAVASGEEYMGAREKARAQRLLSADPIEERKATGAIRLSKLDTRTRFRKRFCSVSRRLAAVLSHRRLRFRRLLCHSPVDQRVIGLQLELVSTCITRACTTEGFMNTEMAAATG